MVGDRVHPDNSFTLERDVKRMRDKMSNLELKVENLTNSNRKLQELVSELSERLDTFMDDMDDTVKDVIKEKDEEISHQRSMKWFESLMKQDND